jgi:hypothetical protein
MSEIKKIIHNIGTFKYEKEVDVKIYFVNDSGLQKCPYIKVQL